MPGHAPQIPAKARLRKTRTAVPLLGKYAVSTSRFGGCSRPGLGGFCCCANNEQQRPFALGPVLRRFAVSGGDGSAHRAAPDHRSPVAQAACNHQPPTAVVRKSTYVHLLRRAYGELWRPPSGSKGVDSCVAVPRPLD
jgi:hypothetical protein